MFYRIVCTLWWSTAYALVCFSIQLIAFQFFASAWLFPPNCFVVSHIAYHKIEFFSSDFYEFLQLFQTTFQNKVKLSVVFTTLIQLVYTHFIYSVSPKGQENFTATSTENSRPFCKVLPQAYLVKLSVDTQKRARFAAGSFVLLLTYILTLHTHNTRLNIA